jgi:hypothetical protein
MAKDAVGGHISDAVRAVVAGIVARSDDVR